jgi:glycerol-3-phosphate acyltransferase PlsY
MLPWLLLILAAYLIGSIPFGVLLARTRGMDIRAHGSKNIGATNVGRVLGRKLGALCFALDVLKGAGPVIAAGIVGDVINVKAADLRHVDMWLWMAVAVAAVLGHMCSIYLRFAGGKGVATSFGAMLAMWPLLTLPAIAALVTWYAILRLTRYVSLASILASLSLPVWYLASIIPTSGQGIPAAITHASPPLIVTSAMALLVVWRHRTNIARLRKGEEPKVGERG